MQLQRETSPPQRDPLGTAHQMTMPKIKDMGPMPKYQIAILVMLGLFGAFIGMWAGHLTREW